MSNVPELFGCMVFDDKVMRARLSADVYRSLRSTMNKGKKLDLSLANAVAAAMCEWAVENGATHFTHWF
ncbi:MAG: glutamine synthetase III, partial [Oscillospiraceae bacterium]|nr:glutamine synthetase III [Oscillospiraceae bacterium]